MEKKKDSGGRINGTKSVELFCYIIIYFINYFVH